MRQKAWRAALAQGSYRLRVVPAENAAEIDRWVSVPEAGEREEDVALSPTRVAGEVRRAGLNAFSAPAAS